MALLDERYVSLSSYKLLMRRALQARSNALAVRPLDEKSFLKGHHYLMVEEGRVLDVVPERTEKFCQQLINQVLVKPYSRFKIEAVAMDMWSAFTKVANALLEWADIDGSTFSKSCR